MGVLGFLADVLLAVFVGLIVLEVTIREPAWSRAMVRRAARRLPDPMREACTAEWLADLGEVTGPLSKILFVGGLFWGASRIRQSWRAKRLEELNKHRDKYREAKRTVLSSDIEMDVALIDDCSKLREMCNRIKHVTTFEEFAPIQQQVGKYLHRVNTVSTVNAILLTQFWHDLQKDPEITEKLNYFRHELRGGYE